MIGKESMDNFKSQYLKFKTEWGKTILVMGGIVLFFLLLRVVNLTLLPVFADEAIYVRWAQVMKAEPTLRFLPLSDGKQPLYMWSIIPFLSFFSDPLFAGRIISVLSGLGTLIGLFFLSFQLFKSRRIALFSSLFYSLVPFAVFFDRMALADSLLACFGVWLFYFSLLLFSSPRLDLAMITGIVLGMALLTKSPATFFALLIPVSFLTVFEKKRFSWEKIIKIIPLLIVVYAFAFVIYNLLRLGPNFQMVGIRNQDYVFSISHFFTNPLDPLQFHLKEIIEWFGGNLTWGVFIFGLGGMIIAFKKNWISFFLLFLWFVFPLFVQAEFAKVFTARYIFFSVPLFLIFVACFLDFLFALLERKWAILVLMALIIPPLVFDYFLLFDPLKAPLARRERSGYLEEWTAGTGIKEASLIFREKAKEKKVLVGTEGYFGTLPDGLQMYLEKVPNITIIGIGIKPTQVPEPLINSLDQNEVYLLINDERLALNPAEHNLTLIASYPKAKRPDGSFQSLLLFQVNKKE